MRKSAGGAHSTMQPCKWALSLLGLAVMCQSSRREGEVASQNRCGGCKYRFLSPMEKSLFAADAIVQCRQS